MDNARLDAIVQEKDRAAELKSKFGIRYTRFADIAPAPIKRWLVKDLLGAGELSCVYGSPGSAKSVLVGDLAAHIAHGADWMGRRVMQGAALIVAAERAALVHRRLAAFRQHHGLEDASIPLAVLSGSFDLVGGKFSAAGIIECAKRLVDESESKVALIVIDTLNRSMAGGDENSAKDMGALVASLSAIQEATGAHILVTHHTPHTESRLRGHGALLGACDTTIKIEKGDLRTATVEKQNDGPEGERVGFNLQTVELGRDPETGDVTEAPVVVPIDGELPSAHSARRMSPRDKRAKDALAEILASKGKAKPAGIDAPVSRVIALDEWKQELLAQGVIEADDANPRATFQRIKNQLAARQIIGERNAHVWLV